MIILLIYYFWQWIRNYFKHYASKTNRAVGQIQPVDNHLVTSALDDLFQILES